MPSLKDLKNRIGSVKNTRKITKAMQMVAASKMRKAQERMRAARPYASKIRNVISHLSYAYTDARVDDPALAGRRPAQTPLHQASATVAWRGARGHALSLTARHVGR